MSVSVSPQGIYLSEIYSSNHFPNHREQEDPFSSSRVNRSHSSDGISLSQLYTDNQFQPNIDKHVHQTEDPFSSFNRNRALKKEKTQSLSAKKIQDRLNLLMKTFSELKAENPTSKLTLKMLIEHVTNQQTLDSGNKEVQNSGKKEIQKILDRSIKTIKIISLLKTFKTETAKLTSKMLFHDVTDYKTLDLRSQVLSRQFYKRLTTHSNLEVRKNADNARKKMDAILLDVIDDDEMIAKVCRWGPGYKTKSQNETSDKPKIKCEPSRKECEDLLNRSEEKIIALTETEIGSSPLMAGKAGHENDETKKKINDCPLPCALAPNNPLSMSGSM